MEINYNSITHGKLQESEVFSIVYNTLRLNPHKYSLYVGTDSQVYDETKVAIVIILYEIGKGGKFFWHIDYERNFFSLRERMFHEATQSIELGKRLTNYLLDKDLEFDIIIHVDLGRKGKTRDLINDIVGYVTAEGFAVEFKPDSIAASVVADRYSK